MVLCFWAPGMAERNSGRRVWEEAAHLMVSVSRQEGGHQGLVQPSKVPPPAPPTGTLTPVFSVFSSPSFQNPPKIVPPAEDR